jgi:hypothetical protein
VDLFQAAVVRECRVVPGAGWFMHEASPRKIFFAVNGSRSIFFGSHRLRPEKIPEQSRLEVRKIFGRGNESVEPVGPGFC